VAHMALPRGRGLHGPLAARSVKSTREWPYRPLSRLTNASYSLCCNAANLSVGQPRDRAELTRRNAGMIAEKPREMRRNIKSEPRADLGEASIARHYCIDGVLEPHHV